MKKALIALVTFFLIASCNEGSANNNGNNGGGITPLPTDKFNLPIDRKALANRCSYDNNNDKRICYNQFGLLKEQWSSSADGSKRYHATCYDGEGRVVKYKTFTIGIDVVPEYHEYCDGTGDFFEYR